MSDKSLGRLGAVALDTDMSRLGTTFTEFQHLARLSIPSLPELPQTVSMRENIAQFTGRGGRLTRGTDNDGVVGLGLFNNGFKGISALDAAIGVKGDTQGYKTDDTAVMRKIAGHPDPVKAPQYGEVFLAHGKDSVELGSKEFPTKWVVVVRSAPTVGDKKWQWSQKVRPYSLAAGETTTITNGEDKLQNTDEDIYITLLEVGESATQITTRKESETAAKQAVAAAQGAITDAQTAGADVTNLTKSLGEANALLAAGKYREAESTAKNVQNSAIDAGTVAKKIALEKQADNIRKDSTLSADAKAQMLKDISDQKAVISTSAAASKAETGLPGGMSFTTAALIGAAGVMVTLAAALLLKKK